MYSHHGHRVTVLAETTLNVAQKLLADLVEFSIVELELGVDVVEDLAVVGTGGVG